MKKYILSIIACAIISSIACSIFDKKQSIGKIVQILTGILMTLTILSPLKRIENFNISNILRDISKEADRYVEEGKYSSHSGIAEIIKQQTEAYILDKANSMELDVTVEVELSDDKSVPCGIEINGSVAPYDKNILSEYIENNIGITKEKQIWN